MPEEVTMWSCDVCKTVHETCEKAEDCCQIKDLEAKRKFCAGCYDDYYNKHEENGCWHLSSAKRVLKKKVHIDQRPPWNQEPEIVLSCYKERGYVFVGPEQIR